MIVYYSLIALIIVFGIAAQYLNSHKPAEEIIYPNGTVAIKNHYSFFYFFIVAAFLIIGGFRYYVGTDFGAYYKELATIPEIIDRFKNLDEPLIRIITYIARKIWDDGVFVIFSENFIIVVLTFFAISKYDQNNIMLYALLFLFTGIWDFSFNGVRQAIACVIIFAGISIIEKQENTYSKLFFKIAILCAFAFLAHKSAILMLPMLLISHRKIDYTQIFILTICAVAIPLFFDNAFNVMEVDIMTEGEGAEYINRQINPIRVPVAFAPLILLALIKDKEELFSNERFITNMAFFHAILNLTTMNSAYMNRITQYTAYFMMVFVVMALNKIDVKIRWLVTSITVILYFSFWLYGLLSPEEPFVFRWSFSHIGEF